jgi:gamma-glutamylcyclotransferase (GGCT)/AIG2-like uncharacterized protein YtfP
MSTERGGEEVFAYGTLLVPEVMEALLGRTVPSAPARLAGFACYRVRGAVFPAALESSGREIRGRLYRGLDPPTLALLDRFEGDLYQRRRLTVELGGGESAAWVYLLAADRSGLLTDEPWSLAEFVQLHLLAYLRGCRAFRSARMGEVGRA